MPSIFQLLMQGKHSSIKSQTQPPHPADWVPDCQAKGWLMVKVIADSVRPSQTLMNPCFLHSSLTSLIFISSFILLCSLFHICDVIWGTLGLNGLSLFGWPWPVPLPHLGLSSTLWSSENLHTGLVRAWGEALVNCKVFEKCITVLLVQLLTALNDISF